MSKLIGKSPNQVPSNADLGTAAFMDKTEFLLSKGSSLSAINTVIPNTAVDVFIYDTTKDSDGGAWRKRTQHLSWYNEKLNTTIRGSRREFPAVAVIIAEAQKITIYDADDASLPMWMVLNARTSVGFIRGSNNFKCVSALNGVMWIGAQVLNYVNFASDSGGWLEQNFAALWTELVNRDTNKGFDYPTSLDSRRTAGLDFTGVDMTVLPNAPIDPKTNLPIPTAAVACDGGLSVIKDDGTVANPSNQTSYSYVDIIGSRCWFGATGPSSVPSRYIDLSTFNNGNPYIAPYSWPGDSLKPDFVSNYSKSYPTVLPDGLAVANLSSPVLLQLFKGDESNPNQGNLSSYITSTYNTGWLPGDIKLATLADTDSTDIAGSELVTNGRFDTDVSGWSDNTTNGSITWDSVNECLYGQTGPTSNELTTTYVDTVVGQTYHVSFLIVARTGASFAVFNHATGANLFPYTDVAANVYYSFNFTANSTSTGLRLRQGSANSTIKIDNFSCIAVSDEDRSTNGNNLQVIGTVKKTPVASGADLVSYGGFSISDYLKTPRSNITQPGTGDFAVTSWVKRNVNGSAMRTVGWALAGTQKRFDVYLHSSNQINLYAAESGNTKAVTTSTPVGEWFQYVALRRNGVFELYIDGELRGTTVDTLNFNYNTKLNVWLGCMSFTDGDTMEDLPLDGELALARVTHTAPTVEQIKKIYEDEKALFQDNAKATLYGTSDAVTALAYDDDTNLLHVGTSAGRSVFQGLRRVDNTTRAVGTAISAVDGFVVEE